MIFKEFQETKEIVARVPQPIIFPTWGWLGTRTTEPVGGRVLVEVRGYSGMSSWCDILLTLPSQALDITKEGRGPIWRPGTYKLTLGTDKRGEPLIRVYATETECETPWLLVAVNGEPVAEGSSGNWLPIAQAEGFSRTRLHGDTWTLVAAQPHAVLAVQEYGYRDPKYLLITSEGLKEIGDTDAVLPPNEW